MLHVKCDSSPIIFLIKNATIWDRFASIAWLIHEHGGLVYRITIDSVKDRINLKTRTVIIGRQVESPVRGRYEPADPSDQSLNDHLSPTLPLSGIARTVDHTQGPKFSCIDIRSESNCC